MNWFLQHIPMFMSLKTNPQKIPFETTEELLNIEIVRRFGKSKKFSHFAISDNYLMEISDSGYHWLVVGIIGDPTSVDLPVWDGGKYKARLQDGAVIELTGNDVSSSCGEVLTLKDGTRAKNLKY